jgi:hypothetical protein
MKRVTGIGGILFTANDPVSLPIRESNHLQPAAELDDVLGRSDSAVISPVLLEPPSICWCRLLHRLARRGMLPSAGS